MYTLREVTLQNGPHEHTSLVIDFTNPHMAIVGEFLMTDASLLNYDILRLIDKVQTEAIETEHMQGNRCALTITSQTTQIVDLFSDIDSGFKTYDTYEIDTQLLKELIVMWRQEKQKRQINGQ